jgi:hypothetical protein
MCSIPFFSHQRRVSTLISPAVIWLNIFQAFPCRDECLPEPLATRISLILSHFWWLLRTCLLIRRTIQWSPEREVEQLWECPDWNYISLFSNSNSNSNSSYQHTNSSDSLHTLSHRTLMTSLLSWRSWPPTGAERASLSASSCYSHQCFFNYSNHSARNIPVLIFRSILSDIHNAAMIKH